MPNLKDFEPLTGRWRARLGPLKRLLLLHRSLRLQYCEFDISGADGGPPLHSVYIGEGLSLSYYLKLYSATVRRVDTRSLWSAPNELDAVIRTVPIVLVEINQLLNSILPEGGLRTAPWIEQETELHSERYRRRKRGIEKGWGQKVRSHAFRYTLSTGRDDLDRFYHEYYLPYVALRHGEAGSVRGIVLLRRALRRGFLLKVWQGEQWVSGLVAFPDGRERVVALADGLHAPLFARRRDAITAAHYFLFHWANENGVAGVNFCGARPHLMDGVFRHKQLWAAESRRDPWHHTQIVFYLKPAVQLPEVITQQLVEGAGALVSIGERL